VKIAAGIWVWLGYTVVATVFAVMYWTCPMKKEVIKWLPAPDWGAPDSVVADIPSTPTDIHVVDGGFSPPVPAVPVVAEIPAEPDTMKRVEPPPPPQTYTSYRTQLHPSFLGPIETVTAVKAPCQATSMNTTAGFKGGEEAARKNFEKQITDKYKKEHPGKFWTGVAVGAGVTGVVVTAIVVSALVKRK